VEVEFGKKAPVNVDKAHASSSEVVRPSDVHTAVAVAEVGGTITVPSTNTLDIELNLFVGDFKEAFGKAPFLKMTSISVESSASNILETFTTKEYVTTLS
jgi:hypothetical protein